MTDRLFATTGQSLERWKQHRAVADGVRPVSIDRQKARRADAYIPVVLMGDSSQPRFSIEIPALTQISPKAQPDETESDILVRMTARQRWAYIADKHPLEFWLGVVSVFAATYVVVQGLVTLWPALQFSVISSAFAQTAKSGDANIAGVSIQTLVAVVMALALLYCYGLASYTTAKVKIDLARENIKALQQFLVGLATGAGASRL
ncbi:hypothetical protein SLNSH_06690 [Alsobacter soli]|uniref:Uncharacterized protein n=1 Tax=Alsobacter soli TaxID=2109933 RepID=A0A2T1HVI6_9HYPH|nr:hypothetical protein [Alsobacter soli]PSC05665.1 hypothetical protein SLNSH_06690 [Alsobacter soli]